MCCKGFWKRIVSFALAFSVGLLIVGVLQKKFSADENQIKVKSVNNLNPLTEGRGASGCCDARSYYPNSQEKSSIISHLKRENVRIISKPKANYSDEARTNHVQGKVVLLVTFLADAQIGGISIISGLPDGLTEQAIAAAKEIKFEPAMKDGKTITVRKPVEYNFTIY